MVILMSEHSAGSTDSCSRYPFCDETPDLVVPALDGSDYPICRGCYESDCGRCRAPIENDDNVAKGLCQDCRDEIRMWGGDDERGIEKEPDSDQTKLITDGGTGQLRPECFNPKCEKRFDSVNEMVAVPGRGGRSARHFCEGCSERIRRGPPMTDGGTAEDGIERPPEHRDSCECHECAEGYQSYLKFAHENIGLVIDGYEDATIRVGLERGFESGQMVELRTPKDRVFAFAEVEECYESRVGQAFFDAEFVDGRETAASSDEDLLDRLGRHYSNDITFDTDVTVIYFNVTELRTPRALRTGTAQPLRRS
jgi:hypothetical protein